MRSTTKRLESRLAAGLGGTMLLALLAVALSPPREDAARPAPPPPAPSPETVPPSAAAAADPAPSLDGLRLAGLLGRGAIISAGDGTQRFVAIGKEVQPGLAVARIAQDHVVLRWSGGEARLGFDGPQETGATPAPRAESAAGEDARNYRLGLTPRRVGGRTTGYVVRADVPMPALTAAGVRPGDVLLGINGSRMDEERMLELPWQLANSSEIGIEIERDGRRMVMSNTAQR